MVSSADANWGVVRYGKTAKAGEVGCCQIRCGYVWYDEVG